MRKENKSWKSGVLAIGRAMALNLSNLQLADFKLANTVKQYLHLADIDSIFSGQALASSAVIYTEKGSKVSGNGKSDLWCRLTLVCYVRSVTVVSHKLQFKAAGSRRQPAGPIAMHLP